MIPGYGDFIDGELEFHDDRILSWLDDTLHVWHFKDSLMKSFEEIHNYLKLSNGNILRVVKEDCNLKVVLDENKKILYQTDMLEKYKLEKTTPKDITLYNTHILSVKDDTITITDNNNIQICKSDKLKHKVIDIKEFLDKEIYLLLSDSSIIFITNGNTYSIDMPKLYDSNKKLEDMIKKEDKDKTIIEKTANLYKIFKEESAKAISIDELDELGQYIKIIVKNNNLDNQSFFDLAKEEIKIKLFKKDTQRFLEMTKEIEKLFEHFVSGSYRYDDGI